MARKKPTVTIENEISKVKSEMSKLQLKYDNPAEKLQELQEQKRKCESDMIMAAYLKSSKSLDEIMKFLKL